MSLAVANSKFASPNLGGGVTSLLTLLEGLHEKYTISVDAFQTPPIKEIEVSFPYNIHTTNLSSVPIFHWVDRYFQLHQWQKFILEEFHNEYDLVIGQDAVGLTPIECANKYRIPSILFIRSLGSTGYYQYHPQKSHMSNISRADLGGTIQYPFVLRNFERYRRAVTDADVVVANSEFTASKLKELFEVSPEIIYPPITIEEYQTNYNDEGVILMANLRTEQKGGDIFLKIAEAMPDEEFRLVGPAPSSIKQKAKNLGNVTHIEWANDMRAEYGRAKAVVVPTKQVESFGRIAAEAMCSGIPCVVSNRGALPEVVGNTCYVVQNLQSIEEWCLKISNAIKEGYDENRINRVEDEFSTENQVNRLVSIIDEYNITLN